MSNLCHALRLTTLHCSLLKKIDNEHAQHAQSVCRNKTTLWTLICLFVVNHKNTVCNVHPYGHRSPYGATWCTTQVGGAQRRSMVHNVVLYSQGGVQRRSHKPTHTYTQTGPILLTRLLMCEVIRWPGVIFSVNHANLSKDNFPVSGIMIKFFEPTCAFCTVGHMMELCHQLDS